VGANRVRLEEKPPVTMATWQNGKTVSSELASAPRHRSHTMPARLFGHVLRHLLGQHCEKLAMGLRPKVLRQKSP
jgi:hypothetical protein